MLPLPSGTAGGARPRRLLYRSYVQVDRLKRVAPAATKFAQGQFQQLEQQIVALQARSRHTHRHTHMHTRTHTRTRGIPRGEIRACLHSASRCSGSSKTQRPKLRRSGVTCAPKMARRPLSGESRRRFGPVPAQMWAPLTLRPARL